MSGAARVAIAFDLSDLTRRVTMAGIRRRHPAYSEAQLHAAWARIVLGDDATRAVWPGRPLVEP